MTWVQYRSLIRHGRHNSHVFDDVDINHLSCEVIDRVMKDKRAAALSFWKHHFMDFYTGVPRPTALRESVEVRRRRINWR